MIKSNKLLLLLSFFFTVGTLMAQLQKVKIEGITYNIWEYNGGYAAVTAPESGDYTGSIEIPASVTYNDREYPVTEISSYAFCYERAVTSIIIPNSVTKIGVNAFLDCRALKTLTIPESVATIQTDAFGGCTLNPLIIKTVKVSDWSRVFERMETSSMIYTYESVATKIKPYFNNVRDVSAPCFVEILDTYIRGVKFKLLPNEYKFGNYELTSVTVDGKECEPESDGTYFVKGISNDGNNSAKKISLLCTDNLGSTKNVTESFTLKSDGLSLSYYGATQTSLMYEVYAATDETAVFKSLRVTIGSPESHSSKIEKEVQLSKDHIYVTFTGLLPNTLYENTYYKKPSAVVIYDDDQSSRTFEARTNYKTYAIEVNSKEERVGPTSYAGSFKWRTGGFEIGETNVYLGRKAGVIDDSMTPLELTDDNSVSVIGLSPKNSYYLNFRFTSKDGSFTTISYYPIATSSLELSTLQPKPVSSTCAIVAATTNICEEETNVGFQWKKYDAPSSLQPSEGYAAIYNGRLEGYIKNLQSAFYYNVRAFYKTSDGTYHYSDWVTFDPSDFSYFEPTVHTYPAQNVTHNTVRVKGYALAGTEEIEEQGFQYWPLGEDGDNVKTLRTLATVSDEIQTVFAKGQIMTAEFDNLTPNTTYCFRAFVTTSSGTTYGEEQVFTTSDDMTGIGNVKTDVTDKVVIGYYDLSGRRLEKPVKGFVIVRYSDGTARKMLLK